MSSGQNPYALGERQAPTGIPEFAPPPVSQQQQPLLRLNLRRALQLHGKLAVTFFALGMVLAVGMYILRKPSYAGTAVLYVQPAPPKLLPNGPVAAWPNDSFSYEAHIQEQLKAITRYDVLKNALPAVTATGWRLKNESDQAAIDRLEKSLEVDRVGTSYQISVLAHAGSPDQAATIANAVANSYIDAARKQERAGDSERLKMLRDESDRVKDELVADRAEQEVLNKKLGVAGVTAGTPNPYDDKIATLRAELVRARAAHDEAASRLVSMQNGGTAAEANLAADADAGLTSLKNNLNQRRSALITQMANLTPSHPLYKQDEAELSQIDAALATTSQQLQQKAASNITQKLSTDLETTAGTESRINAELAQATAQAGGSIRLLQRSNEVTSDIQRLQQRFATVDEQLRNQTLEDAAPIGLHLVSPAVAPLRPEASKTFRIALVLVVGFTLMGLAAAVLRMKLDPRIYTAQDIEEFLGFPPMAVLPESSDVSEGVSEEYLLRLTASIEGARHSSGCYRFVFTAPATGTGVSHTVTRVKAMMDAMGKRAVLVNASTSQPTVVPAGVVNHGNPQPISELSTALTRASEGPTEVLRAIDHFGMDPVSGQQDIVLTDAAPLPISAEAEYLVRFSDATVVIVESGRTTRPELEHVVQMLAKLKVRNVGFLLNRVALKTADPIFASNIRSLEERLKATGWQSARARRPVTPPPTQPRQQAPVRQREDWPSATTAQSEQMDPGSRRQRARFTAEPAGEPRVSPVAEQPVAEPVAEPIAQGIREVEAPVVPEVARVETVRVEASRVEAVKPAVPAAEDRWVPSIPPPVPVTETSGEAQKPVGTPGRPRAEESVSRDVEPRAAVEDVRWPATPVTFEVTNPKAEEPVRLATAEPMRVAQVVPEPERGRQEVGSPTRVVIPEIFQNFAQPIPRWSELVRTPDSMRNAPAIPDVGAEGEPLLVPDRIVSPESEPLRRAPFVFDAAEPLSSPDRREWEKFAAPVEQAPRWNTDPWQDASPWNQVSEAFIEPFGPVSAEPLVPRELPTLMAKPEILPPEQAELELPKKASKPLHPDKDDDDMQILPSWRGQYRRQKP